MDSKLLTYIKSLSYEELQEYYKNNNSKRQYIMLELRKLQTKHRELIDIAQLCETQLQWLRDDIEAQNCIECQEF